MSLPADDHVHSRFSWDAFAGDMEGTCRRAVDLGLPAVSFTEHVDFEAWSAPPGGWRWPEGVRGTIDGHGRFLGAPLEVEAYVAEVARCRDLFPALTIRTGIELDAGHRYPQEVADLLRTGFDRVVGSVHALADLADPGQFLEVSSAFAQRTAVDVVLAYLEQVREMVASDVRFEVLGHVDYPLRHWPAGLEVPWPELEEPLRHTLSVLAASGRALEVNTSLPLDLRIVRWWCEAGGDAVAFGSDAHSPGELGQRFREVARAVESAGFRPADDPTALWGRA
ncbi:histidinol-phosphatase HisJ family protein [Kineococcus rhizosphaerae]|uniref:Histidinol-phosphatase n=1 Tax=Kineococcus rhizosphaerae TaxID=559628 RepID=A0A2T0R8E9_9ACTN|nr:histidinol-phosphatase HisJ family protein [Kineococcus rhizosphaerae]PRY17384.1 histidinol-phosphatase (PHP family) [Kineococcus rhizosphaerae]